MASAFPPSSTPDAAGGRDALRDAFKEQVRDATDIVDVVGSYVALRRQGKGLVGLCPWHDDSRPSLQVNPERQTFRCWVCNVGGDVFSFLMRAERLEFPEALEQLAISAGIDPPRGRGGSSQRSAILAALAFAAERFRRSLRDSPEAAAARAYLAERGFTEASIEQAGIGFVPDRWDWLLRQAAAAGIATEHLEQAGLVIRKQEKHGFYDRFRGRVIFPIRDGMGRCVAFGGRTLPGVEATGAAAAKYINSPETPVFSKSNMLYGLDRAREAIAACRRAIVVEGYTDCIAAHQAGVHETVAVLGTALGSRHARLLRRYADRAVIVLDGDEAGRRRADEVLDVLLAEPLDIRIARLPEGQDPCDLIAARGAEGFLEFVDSATDALDYRLEEAVARLPADAGDAACLAAVESVLAAVGRGRTAAAASGGGSEYRIREDQVLGRLARRFGIDRSVLRARLRDLAEGPASPVIVEARQPLPPWDREVLEVLVGVPGGGSVVVREVPAEELESSQGRLVIEAARQLYSQRGEVELRDLLDALPDPAIQSLLVEVDEVAARRAADPRHRLEELTEAARVRRARNESHRSARLLKSGRLGEDAQLELLEQVAAQTRLAQGLSDPKEG